MMRNSMSGPRFFVVAALLLATGILLHARHHTEKIATREPLAGFPLQVGGWQGQEMPISNAVREVLGPGDLIDRVYRNAPGPAVGFFVAYFPSQRTGATMHSPKNCLPGAGWMPVESDHVNLLVQNGQKFQVNRYVIAKGSDRQLVLYWYQAHNRIVASEYWARAYLAVDAMRMNRTDGALVRVITPIPSYETTETAQNRAVDFAQQVLPTLPRYIPE